MRIQVIRARIYTGETRVLRRGGLVGAQEVTHKEKVDEGDARKREVGPVLHFFWVLLFFSTIL